MTPTLPWLALAAALVLPGACNVVEAGERIKARVASIHDGDTISLSIRLAGVDTPELGHLAKCAEEARMAETARRYVASQINAVDRRVEIEITGSDKYSRTLARVFVDGRDLSRLLIAAGLGRAYEGGKREGWC